MLDLLPIINGIKNNKEVFKIWWGKYPYFEYKFLSHITFVALFHIISIYMYLSISSQGNAETPKDMVLLLFIYLFYIIIPFLSLYHL